MNINPLLLMRSNLLQYIRWFNHVIFDEQLLPGVLEFVQQMRVQCPSKDNAMHTLWVEAIDSQGWR